jgi:NADP-dependent 3-hydroxy acid dehydrogenase YdfG
MTRTVLVTGATAGFGEATARRFAKDGWNIIITGRRAAASTS